MSSKTRSHDVVGASGEAEMEDSAGEGGGYRTDRCNLKNWSTKD